MQFKYRTVLNYEYFSHVTFQLSYFTYQLPISYPLKNRCFLYGQYATFSYNVTAVALRSVIWSHCSRRLACSHTWQASEITGISFEAVTACP